MARLAGLADADARALLASVLPPWTDQKVIDRIVAEGSDLLAALRMSDGHRAWQVTIPAPVEAPLSAVPGGILIYTATVPLPC